MKKILAFSFMFICCLSLFGQEQKKYANHIDYLFDKAEYIFEGEIIKTERFIDVESSKSYALITIKVSEEYRGIEKIKNQQVELIAEVGSVYTEDGETILIPLDHPMRVAQRGVYFCIVSDRLPNRSSNYVRLDLLNSIENNKNESRFTSTLGIGTDKVFKTKGEIYEFVKQHNHRTIGQKK